MELALHRLILNGRNSCIILTGAKGRTQDFCSTLKCRSTATVEFLKTKELTQLVNNVCPFVPSVLVVHTVAVLNQYVFMHFCNFLRIYTQILYITLFIHIYIRTHRSLSLSKYINQIMAYDCMTQGLWQVKNSYSLV